MPLEMPDLAESLDTSFSFLGSSAARMPLRVVSSLEWILPFTIDDVRLLVITLAVVVVVVVSFVARLFRASSPLEATML